jgi:large exoprotein involved in heme utilization and adhesion
VSLSAPTLVALFDSTISAAVGGGAGTTGGNVEIDPTFVVLSRSAILANAFEGRGGNIRIVADYFFADPSSVIDASSQRSIDGTVIIEAPDTDLGEELAALPSDIVDPSSQLAERCAARQGAAPATFGRSGRGGLPAAPGAPATASLSSGGLGGGTPLATGPVLVALAATTPLAGCAP